MFFGSKIPFQNPRFADGILLGAKTLPQVMGMFRDLATEAAKVGLQLHMGKTKVIGNVRRRRGVSAARNIEVAGQQVEVLPLEGEVRYLGRVLTLGDHYHDAELDNRMARAWKKFYANKR